MYIYIYIETLKLVISYNTLYMYIYYSLLLIYTLNETLEWVRSNDIYNALLLTYIKCNTEMGDIKISYILLTNSDIHVSYATLNNNLHIHFVNELNAIRNRLIL